MKKTGKKIIVGAMVATGALSFTACRNVPTTVYGPPEQFERPVDQTTAGQTKDFEPESNIPVDVYGPPSYWDSDTVPADEVEETEEETAEETDESVTFKPEDNIPVAVYGPPEWFSGQQPTAQP